MMSRALSDYLSVCFITRVCVRGYREDLRKYSWTSKNHVFIRARRNWWTASRCELVNRTVGSNSPAKLNASLKSVLNVLNTLSRAPRHAQKWLCILHNLPKVNQNWAARTKTGPWNYAATKLVTAVAFFDSLLRLHHISAQRPVEGTPFLLQVLGGGGSFHRKVVS